MIVRLRPCPPFLDVVLTDSCSDGLVMQPSMVDVKGRPQLYEGTTFVRARASVSK